jgi:uncharacterized membrane protein HdeD (DUF308 family)
MANAAREAERVSLRAINELWWMGALQGIFALFFGITALFWPALSLVTLVYLFSSFVLAIGIVEIVYAVLNIGMRSTWWMSLLVGLIALGAGTYLVRHPGVSFKTFILIIGLTFIARGLVDTFRIFMDKSRVTNKALLAIVSIASIAAGIVILLQPVSGGLAFVWILGLYAMIYGALMIAVSFELHKELQELLEELGDTKQSVSVRTRG